MDRLISTNSVPFANRDIAPVTGTPQYATSGSPGVTPATVFSAYHWNMLQDEIMAVILAAGITPDDTNWAQLLGALNTMYGGQLSINVQKITSSGTYVPHAGLVYAIAEMCGAGAGSGGTQANGNGNAAGGGGGAGAYIKALLTAAQIGASLSATIGAGGTAGSTSAGGNGGTTSLGSLLTCTGGSGGAQGNPAYSGGQGGAGGTATVTTGTEIRAVPGQPGGNGNENQLVVGGAGGNTPLGFGGQATVARASTTTVDGIMGTGYGSGASGGADSVNGAAGRPGVIIILEFYK